MLPSGMLQHRKVSARTPTLLCCMLGSEHHLNTASPCPAYCWQKAALSAGSAAQLRPASTRPVKPSSRVQTGPPQNHSKMACAGRMPCKGCSQLQSATGPRPRPAGQCSPVSSAWAACRALIRCQLLLSRALELHFGGTWWPGPMPSSWPCMPTPCATRCLLLVWIHQARGGCVSKATGWLTWPVEWLHEQVGLRLRPKEVPAR